MTPDEAQRLARLLLTRRQAAGLSARELARRAGVDSGTVVRIEQGQIARPRADSLRALGAVLGISAADLFTAAEWLPGGELPTFRPYLRAKYRELPDEAVAEMAAVFDRIARDYGLRGPAGCEDEHD
jgi:transcriptional regulator with XRE-family HTH domain